MTQKEIKKLYDTYIEKHTTRELKVLRGLIDVELDLRSLFKDNDILLDNDTRN